MSAHKYLLHIIAANVKHKLMNHRGYLVLPTLLLLILLLEVVVI